jgi:hypothetical protein
VGIKPVASVGQMTPPAVPIFSSWSHPRGVAYGSFAISGAVGQSGSLLGVDDFGGNLGRGWRETAEGDANGEMLIHDLMDGQYSRPACIIAFNTAEGWSRDVTVDIADELRRRFAEYDDVPLSVEEFLENAGAKHG